MRANVLKIWQAIYFFCLLYRYSERSLTKHWNHYWDQTRLLHEAASQWHVDPRLHKAGDWGSVYEDVARDTNPRWCRRSCQRLPLLPPSRSMFLPIWEREGSRCSSYSFFCPCSEPHFLLPWLSVFLHWLFPVACKHCRHLSSYS